MKPRSCCLAPGGLSNSTPAVSRRLSTCGPMMTGPPITRRRPLSGGPDPATHRCRHRRARASATCRRLVVGQGRCGSTARSPAAICRTTDRVLDQRALNGPDELDPGAPSLGGVRTEAHPGRTPSASQPLPASREQARPMNGSSRMTGCTPPCCRPFSKLNGLAPLFARSGPEPLLQPSSAWLASRPCPSPTEPTGRARTPQQAHGPPSSTSSAVLEHHRVGASACTGTFPAVLPKWADERHE